MRKKLIATTIASLFIVSVTVCVFWNTLEEERSSIETTSFGELQAIEDEVHEKLITRRDRDEEDIIIRKTTAYRCDHEFRDINFQENSRSQHGEDRNIVDFFFKGICGGKYIELGALDGIRYSNSHFFRKAHWKGVLIEPNPKLFEQLKINRPGDELFNNAICSQEKEVHFAEGIEVAASGIFEFMPLSFREKWHAGKNVEDLPKIACRPLHGLIDQSDSLKGQLIDFLSLDVEGGEFEVIKTINFEENKFGLIFYEADIHNPLKNEAMKTFLEKNGYIFRFHLGGSNYHVNHDWELIYQALLV